MPQSVTLYNLLISCPSDIKDEVKIIESAAEEFNELYAEPLGITLKTRHWSKSSYSQSGGKPQALLNEQIVDKSDAAVAIFWTKFGSPTDEYGSGTEEEIERMLQSEKQVFMYFSDKPIPPSEMNSEGYKKVQAFREKYADKGIYFTYLSNEEFKKLFFAHLSMFFLSEKKVKEVASERVSELKLVGIDEFGKLSEDASIYAFSLNADITMAQYIDTIKGMYQDIAGMNVGTRRSVNSAHLDGFKSPMEIDEDEQKYLESIAKQLQLSLPENFFQLGNLSKNAFSFTPLTGPSLEGTPTEIQKYSKIKKLHETISKAIEWAPIEKAFSNKSCIRLAIQNCGKAIDEDLEITFEIPKSVLLTLDEFPKFKSEEMGYLLNDCDMSVLFGIDSTAEYDNYAESEITPKNTYISRNYGLPGYAPNYNDDFIDVLDDVFCYSIYSDQDNFIIKLKVDYIKHNTTIAFPSVLLVKDTIPEIPYKITSKNNPNVVEGILKISTNH